ncbi:MAG: ATP-binding protein, partial [bacterium]
MSRSLDIPALLQGTIDAITDAIKIVSPHYKILFVNRATEQQVGKTCDEVSGKLCYAELKGYVDPCPHCLLRIVLESAQAQQVEYSSKQIDGQRRDYEQFVYPLFKKNGELLGLVEVTRDVTEKRLFERQLLHAEKLAALGQLCAAIAHEIRNPLTGIRLGIDTLLDEQLEERFREILAAVSDDTRRLDQVLTQLLDFARRKEAKREDVDVAALIERSLFFIRKQAKTQGVEVHLALQRNLPAVRADLDQLQQVLVNVFINALQAMPKGGLLSVRLDRLTHGANSGILIAVQDTGVGIPAEYKEKLFEMFFSTKSSGSGIGLALTNKIISEH